MGISLKKTFDYLAAPSPVVDAFGQNPLSKNMLSRLASRPDFIIPAGLSALMITGSALTLTSKETASVALQYVLATSLYAGRRVLNDPIVLSQSPTYFLDRTAKGNILKTQSIAVTKDLIFKKKHSKTQLLEDSLFIAPFIGGSALMAPSILPLGLITGASYLTYHAAMHWRASRALSGDWKVLETIPPQKEEERVMMGNRLPSPASP